VLLHAALITGFVEDYPSAEKAAESVAHPPLDGVVEDVLPIENRLAMEAVNVTALLATHPSMLGHQWAFRGASGYRWCGDLEMGAEEVILEAQE
jgi:hypothetical protein